MGLFKRTPALLYGSTWRKTVRERERGGVHLLSHNFANLIQRLVGPLTVMSADQACIHTRNKRSLASHVFCIKLVLVQNEDARVLGSGQLRPLQVGLRYPMYLGKTMVRFSFLAAYCYTGVDQILTKCAGDSTQHSRCYAIS